MSSADLARSDWGTREILISPTCDPDARNPDPPMLSTTLEISGTSFISGRHEFAAHEPDEEKTSDKKKDGDPQNEGAMIQRIVDQLFVPVLQIGEKFSCRSEKLQLHGLFCRAIDFCDPEDFARKHGHKSQGHEERAKK